MTFIPRWKTIRDNLFATPLDTVITLVVAFLLWRAFVPVIEWMLLDATFTGTTRADCVSGGACWVFVKARFGQFMYGLYPPTERWRVDLAGAILVVSVAALSWKALPVAPRASRSRPSSCCRRSASGCSPEASACPTSRRANGAG